MNFDRVQQFLERLPITHRDTGQVVPFHLNPNQQKMHAAIKEKQASQRKPVRYISVKSRRVGVSSYTDGLLTAHCSAQALAKAMIVAHQFKSSKALFQIPLSMVHDFPYVLPDPTQSLITFPHEQGASTLTLTTAGSVVGGRGMTLTALHLSEAAYFPGAGSFLSLLPTISKVDPNTIIGIESTANGKEGPGEAFYDLWMAAINGDSEYIPIFLSFLDDPACIRDASEASDAPRTNLERELMKPPFNASKAQIAWMRMILEGECQGNEDHFMQEYPWTWEVAFISSGDPAFTHADIAKARQTIKKPIDIGAFVRVDRTNVRFEPARDGWRIYEHPKRDCFYYIGADAARGTKTGDFASATVWNGTTGHQAAVLEQRIDPETLADVLNCAGRYYRTGSRCAMMNIELTGNLGLWTQQLLRDLYHYPNIYRWLSRNDRVKKAGQQRNSLGWETQWRSRERIFVVFRAALSHGRAIVHDEKMLAQMEAAQRTERIYQFEVTKGHDDVLMGGLIGWIAVEDYPPPKMSNVGTMLRDWEQEAETNLLHPKRDGGIELATTGQVLQASSHLKEIQMKRSRKVWESRLGLPLARML